MTTYDEKLTVPGPFLRPRGDTPWKRFQDERPAYDGEGERHLLTWSVRVGTYDIACVNGEWGYGEEIEGHPDDLWRWLDDNPEAALASHPETPRDAAGKPVPPAQGAYTGDVFFGDDADSTRATHRWDGAKWMPLPAPDPLEPSAE